MLVVQIVMEPKFLLPSPNFNKNSKDPSKSNLHYLTPCGMTLLPRAKQPPPMYGARGSTVPAKYLKQELQQESNNSVVVAQLDTPPIYNPPPRREYCSNCGMGLATAQDMRRHLEQHETCPADNCDFAALASILERHIEANHITGLYKTVKKVWTPEDIAAWRAERRQRFPTAVNVDTAKRAREQRLKRGERLEASKARFGKPEDRRRTRPQNNPRERQQNNSRERPQNNRKDRPQHNKGQRNNVNKTVDKKEQSKQETNDKPATEQPITTSCLGIPKFCGTSQMADYEHVKQKPKAALNALSSMLGMYGTDSEEETEEDEDEELNLTPITLVESKLRIDTTEQPQTDVQAAEVESKLSMDTTEEPQTDIQVMTENSSLLMEETETNDLPMEEASSSDEGPNEVPIERKTEDPLCKTEAAPDASVPQMEKPSAAADKSNTKAVAKRSAPKKRQYGLNYKRARHMSKQNTMLSKLLAPDIRHERNVLLQCVRYVCEQNFFGIGASLNTATKHETNSLNPDTNQEMNSLNPTTNPEINSKHVESKT